MSMVIPMDKPTDERFEDRVRPQDTVNHNAYSVLLAWTKHNQHYEVRYYPHGSDARIEYTKSGLKHSLFGPAVWHSRSGEVEYWINGGQVDEHQYWVDRESIIVKDLPPIRRAENALYDALAMIDGDNLSMADAKNAMAIAASAISEHLTNENGN